MFGGFGGPLADASWAVLLVGFGLAAYSDVRIREAPDLLWLTLGVLGLALGAVALLGTATLGLLLWILVGALVVQHFVPWDVPLERIAEPLPGLLELAAYVGVGSALGYLAWTTGIGPGEVPAEALAAYAAVVLARALFELGLLYGGADAKALIAAAMLLPLAPVSLLAVPAGATRLATIVPGPITILMDAALLSIAVPIYLGIRNARAGEFDGRSSFVGYRIPVRELTDRFVWLKDPVFGTPTEEEEAVETSDDDRALRERQRARLEAAGVSRVWVTPQVPFLLFFFLGAAAAAVAGNLLFDLLGLL